jgi:hypothetical protein
MADISDFFPEMKRNPACCAEHHQLDREDRAFCVRLALERDECRRKWRLHDKTAVQRHKSADAQFLNDYFGVAGELVVRRHLGIATRWNDAETRATCDMVLGGHKVEVKTTRWPQNAMLIVTTDQIQADIYVLTSVMRENALRIAGWQVSRKVRVNETIRKWPWAHTLYERELRCACSLRAFAGGQDSLGSDLCCRASVEPDREVRDDRARRLRPAHPSEPGASERKNRAAPEHPEQGNRVAQGQGLPFDARHRKGAELRASPSP